MEYAWGGELYDYIVEKGRLEEKEAWWIFHQILEGLDNLRRIGVAHRDLKPENVLLDGKKNVKILDFGGAKVFKEGEKLKTACGNPTYLAPEMIMGKGYSGP